MYEAFILLCLSAKETFLLGRKDCPQPTLEDGFKTSAQSIFLTVCVSGVQEALKSAFSECCIKTGFVWAHKTRRRVSISQKPEPTTPTGHLWLLKLAPFATTQKIACCPSPWRLTLQPEKEEDIFPPITQWEYSSQSRKIVFQDPSRNLVCSNLSLVIKVKCSC